MARTGQRESGFALLLLFVLAAAISIMLYQALPRVVFEAQRGKEQLLIDRGEQYLRAIQLYGRKFNGQYPARLEQLENTNNMRFLRRKYKDPMTGSDEWRLIHIAAGGIFPDSLTMKPPQKKLDGSDSSSSASNDPSAVLGQSGQPPAPAGPGLRRTASDRGPLGNLSELAPGQGSGDDSQGQGQGDAGYPPPPEVPPADQAAGAGQVPGEAGAGQEPPAGTAPQPGVPGADTGIVQTPAQTGLPFTVTGQMQPGGTPQAGASQNLPLPLRQQLGRGAGGLVSGMIPPTPSSDSSQPSDSNNQALGAIGANLRGQGRPPTSSGGLTIGGGGIAGVASKLEAEGIKVYRKRSKYNEWEFIYDPRTDPSTPAGRQAMMGLPPGMRQGGTGVGGTVGTGTGVPTGPQQ